MSDEFVYIELIATPGPPYGRVTQRAFDNIWADRGYRIVPGGTPPSDQPFPYVKKVAELSGDVTAEELIEALGGVPGGGGGGSLPNGGNTGQVLAKASNANGDVTWAPPGSGGVTQVNGKTGPSVTLNADDLADGSAKKMMTAAERTKLTGVATAATANSTDAQLRDRSTHTGSQPSSSISDFTEAVQDAVAALLQQGTNVTLTYNDAANTLTVASAGGSGGLDAEAVRDTIGLALVGTGLVAVAVNDALDTITISTTATQNDTDANLRARSSHTGTQSADTVVDGSTNKAYTATEKTKLAGIATGATANSADSALLNRSNHTGSQAASTISDLTEAVQDIIGAALAGSGAISVSYNDAGNAITISTTATVNSTDAQLRDRTTHTGTQSADTLTDGSSKVAMTTAERSKLSGIAAGATANSSDSALVNRANHTGSQAASTISDSTTAGRALLTAASVAAQRTALDVYSKAEVDSAVAAASSSKIPQTSVTGTAKTLGTGDAGVTQRCSNAATQTLTVPPNSSAAIPVDTVIPFVQWGAGQVVIAPGAGVTIRTASSYTTRAQYAEGKLWKVATDEWLVSGDLT